MLAHSNARGSAQEHVAAALWECSSNGDSKAGAQLSSPRMRHWKHWKLFTCRSYERTSRDLYMVFNLIVEGV